MSKLRKLVENKEKVLTAELFAPKGIGMKSITKKIDILRDHIDLFNVTDNQRATMRVSSIGLCAYIERKFGVETVYQLNCRDRNRIALQSDLLAASLLGLKNVLVITGDHPSIGDHLYSKPVYDLDSVQLLQTIGKLNSGVDFSGNKLRGKPEIFAGATINPVSRPMQPHLLKFKKKVRAGAKFFQTQVVFDTGLFKEFYKEARHEDTSILAGISLIKDVKFAKFINDSVPGLNIPDRIIKRLSTGGDLSHTRIDIACEIIDQLKDSCQGFHFMVFGLEKEIPVILKETSLTR